MQSQSNDNECGRTSSPSRSQAAIPPRLVVYSVLADLAVGAVVGNDSLDSHPTRKAHSVLVLEAEVAAEVLVRDWRCPQVSVEVEVQAASRSSSSALESAVVGECTWE